ncbi:hypothetical protein ACLKA6_001774 [Drosophila palustris]
MCPEGTSCQGPPRIPRPTGRWAPGNPEDHQRRGITGLDFSRIVQEPFETLCADFVGPLPRSKLGNTFLLVFFDHFSRTIRTLVCDNGTQFTSGAFRTFCQQLGMTLQHTAPYSPQQNPTKRANRTIKTMIAQYLDGEQNNWDALLPEMTLAINSSPSDSSGFSPTYLVQ